LLIVWARSPRSAASPVGALDGGDVQPLVGGDEINGAAATGRIHEPHFEEDVGVIVAAHSKGSGRSSRRRQTGKPRPSATSEPTRIETASSGCSIGSSSSVVLLPDTTRPENLSMASSPWSPQKYGCHTLSTGPSSVISWRASCCSTSLSMMAPSLPSSLLPGRIDAPANGAVIWRRTICGVAIIDACDVAWAGWPRQNWPARL
jgi:hypothetical protein